jgi:hypothetical protein
VDTGTPLTPPAGAHAAKGAQPAEPPGGGRQDHDVMHDAAMRPVSGPASTDSLAASGGLEIPGRESHPELAHTAPADSSAHHPHEMIPGERDATTLTHREPGAVGGRFAGADVPSPDPHEWLDEQTAREHALEGGGGVARKRKTNKQVEP